jgi:hypothetical protein
MRAARDISVQPLPGVAYAPRPDATPEAEISALAAVYRIVLSRKKEAVSPDKSGPDDEKERSSNDSLASNHSTA